MKQIEDGNQNLFKNCYCCLKNFHISRKGSNSNLLFCLSSCHIVSVNVLLILCNSWCNYTYGIMRFDLVTFLSATYHVELGLIVCLMRYPQLRVWSGRNIVRMHLFPDHTHILLILPFIPVTFTDHFGSSRCLWIDIYRSRIVVSYLWNLLFIYRKSLLHFV